uniref:Methyltransferase domain-containing protein n=1 Tax=Sinocyclocheilus grahami TaxID=75366 RepID=A0A672K6F5_SINGR
DVGYCQLTNIDISETVVSHINQRYAEHCPDLTFQQLDATQTCFESGSFLAALDKGTLDAMASEEDGALAGRSFGCGRPVCLRNFSPGAHHKVGCGTFRPGLHQIPPRWRSCLYNLMLHKLRGGTDASSTPSLTLCHAATGRPRYTLTVQDSLPSAKLPRSNHFTIFIGEHLVLLPFTVR